MKTLKLTLEDGGVGVIQMDRLEKRNALDGVMHDELIAALDAWAWDDAVACVMLIGDETIFCAGWDLSVLDGIRGEEQRRFTELAHRLMAALHDYRKPTIAAVAGMAPGYGMDLANMCDVTVASESARFGSTQVKYGMNGYYGALQRKVGPMRARRMFFTGDPIDVHEAHRIGMVDEVVPEGQLRGAGARDRPAHRPGRRGDDDRPQGGRAACPEHGPSRRAGLRAARHARPHAAPGLPRPHARRAEADPRGQQRREQENALR